MKVAITRNQAIWMNKRLSSMNFGHFDRHDLEKMVANDGAIRRVVEDYKRMITEMQRRLYDGVERQTINAFNKTIRESAAQAESQYPELYALFEKQRAVDMSLRMKVIEIDLEPINRESFIKAAILGKADIPQGSYAMFAPMFVQDSTDDDYNELDDLMRKNNL